MSVRKVLFGTPCHDGRLDVWFVNAMRHTEKLLNARDIDTQPIYVSFDSLVQRARNDLVRLALEDGYDDLIFIDSDMEWRPEWALALLDHPVDCVGAAYRKKTDDQEIYTVRSAQLPIPVDPRTGLWTIDGIGTGFLRLSRKALQALWDSNEEYKNEGRLCRWIFDVCVVDNTLVSEDNILCEKLKQLGFTVFLDPSFTPTHIGQKKFAGDFASYVATLAQAAEVRARNAA